MAVEASPTGPVNILIQGSTSLRRSLGNFVQMEQQVACGQLPLASASNPFEEILPAAFFHFAA